MRKFLILIILFICISGVCKENIYPMLKIHKSPLTDIKLEIKQFTFKNKLNLYLIQNKNAPVLHYRTYYHVGSVYETDGVRGIAHLFEHMMFIEFTKKDKDGKIIKKLNRGDIENIYKDMGGIHLNATTGTDRTSYFVSVPKNKIEDVIKIEALRIKYLDISQELLETEKNAVFTEFSRKMDNPWSALDFYFDQFAFDAHPYKYPTIGTIQDLTKISLADCFNFYQKYYAPQNASIFVVGDVDENNLINLINQYYGEYKNEISLEYPYIITEPIQEKEKIKTITHHITNEKIMIGYKIPGSTEKYNKEFNSTNKLVKKEEFTSKDLASLTILGTLMAQGLSSDFERELIGSNLASSYGYYMPELQYPNAIYFYIDAAQNIKSENIIPVIDKIISKYKNTLIQKEDLTRVKNQSLLAVYQSLESVDSLTEFITSGFIAGNKDPLFSLRAIEQMKKIKPEDIKRVALKYLNEKRRAIIYMKPGEPPHKGWFDKITGRDGEK
jgi:zinc protease